MRLFSDRAHKKILKKQCQKTGSKIKNIQIIKNQHINQNTITSFSLSSQKLCRKNENIARMAVEDFLKIQVL